MNRATNDSKFILFFKSLLKEAGFNCRGNICENKDSELKLKISFRNRWGWPISDIYMTLSDSEFGDLFQDDIRLIFPGYFNLRANFSDEELLALDESTEARVGNVITQEVIPQALALTQRNHFLAQVDAGRFAGNGIYVSTISKLRDRA